MKTTINKTPQSTSVKQLDKSVKTKNASADGLRKLFEAELKDIYWAEKALTKAIPKMVKNATSDELTEALSDHLKITIMQVSRLEEVFDLLGLKAVAKKCEAMAGLIMEAEGIMAETVKGVVRDAGIILAGQKVEHYEIATYGTLVAFAKTLREDKAASMLEETLNEEKEADEALSKIAETINVEAADEDDEDDKKNVKAKSKTKKK